MLPAKIIFFITPEDEPYASKVKALIGPIQTGTVSVNPNYGSEVIGFCKSKGYKHAIVTNETVLNKLITISTLNFPKAQKINNWAGSMLELEGIQFLFLAPFKQLISMDTGVFLAKRYISKLLAPEKWKATPAFTYETLNAQSVEAAYVQVQSAICTAVDIETITWTMDNGTHDGIKQTIIQCACYTILSQGGTIHTYVIPLSLDGTSNALFWVSWMRKFNLTSPPKIFQNGLYDNFHFLCYQAPVRNYIFDTQSMFHSWYCELPKDLGSITAFNVKDSWYWKDLAGSNLAEYNARDGWATMLTFLNMTLEFPEYAWRNYYIKFPLFAPCMACNIEGEKINEEKRQEIHAYYNEKKTTILAQFKKWFHTDFNPGSWQQVQKLIHFYGQYNITGTDDTSLEKFAFKHPLYAIFARKVQEYRTTVKVMGNNIKIIPIGAKQPADFSPLTIHGRTFYALNPDGTDTGRLACREGANWLGAQIQNIPREETKIKEMYIPDSEDWEMFEIDYKSSESYSTGYLSGDPTLLKNLANDRDFHKNNAEMFFGIPYDQITDALRYLGKRINHGSNYGMQAFMLLNTMTEKKVSEAKMLLKLPAHWSLLMVAEHLLSLFDKTYVVVKGDWYKSIELSVALKHKMVSELGWTRHCFGDPIKDKHMKKAYIAHGPQNLSVGIINEAFKDCFWQLHVRHYNDFRLHAQIHDSIKGIVRKGHRELVATARNLCIRTKRIKDFRGEVREMTIPVEVKMGPNWANMEVVQF